MRWALIAIGIGCAAQAEQASPEQLFRDAVAAQQRGDMALAIKTYRALLAERPDAFEARANLGAALAHEARYDEAIEQYRAALALKDSPPLRGNLGLAYYKKGDFAAAAREFQTLLAQAPTDARLAALTGDCDSRLGRYNDAISALLPAEAAHPDDLDVAWALGTALIHAGRTKEGIERVARVAAQRESAEADLVAGEARMQLNEFERARDYSAAGLRLNPSLPGLYTLSGKVKQFLGDYPAAKADLAMALAANPNDFDAHLTLAAILNTERDLDAARKHIDDALRIQPGSALALYERARIERSGDQLEAAAKDFESVEKQEPNWLQPHVELAALYYRVHRPADGQRERAIVEKLNAGQLGVNVPAPSP